MCQGKVSRFTTLVMDKLKLVYTPTTKLFGVLVDSIINLVAHIEEVSSTIGRGIRVYKNFSSTVPNAVMRKPFLPSFAIFYKKNY